MESPGADSWIFEKQEGIMYVRNLGLSWLRHSTLVVGAAVLSMLTWQTAFAQLDTEHKTVVSFTGPVEVPGSNPQVLPAGSYMFKVVDSKSNRNIVQVSNKEETHVYTTILAIPTHRDEETDKTVITFEERAAGAPQAIRAWFYPHERSGQEFVYSKDRATQLAKSSNSPVPYSDSANSNAPVSTTASRSATETDSSIRTMMPTGQSAPYTQQAQASAPAPVTRQQSQASTSAPVTRQQSTTPAPANRQPSQATAPASTTNGQQTQDPVQTANNLPQTASDLPWLAMAGCLLLIAGFSIKKLCER